MTIRSVWTSFLDDVLELDLPLLKTPIALTVNPARVCREYVEGYRRRYTAPLKYAFVAAALMVVAYAVWGRSVSATMGRSMGLPHIESTSRNSEQAESPDNSGEIVGDDGAGDESREAVRSEIVDSSDSTDQRRHAAERLAGEITSFVDRNINYLSLLSLPVVALALAMVNRRSGFNYAEHLSFTCFVWGHMYLVHAILAFTGMTTIRGAVPVIMLGSALFETWAVTKFYGRRAIVSFLSVILAEVAAMIAVSIVAIAIAIPYVVFVFNRSVEAG